MPITQNFCFEDHGRLFRCYLWVPASSNTLHTHKHTVLSFFKDTSSVFRNWFLDQAHFGSHHYWFYAKCLTGKIQATKASEVLKDTQASWTDQKVLPSLCRLERHSNRQKEDKRLETSHHLRCWTRQSLVGWLYVVVSARHTPIDTFTQRNGEFVSTCAITQICPDTCRHTHTSSYFDFRVDL